MRKHHSVLGGVALALALTLTGCSDDGISDPDATDTPTATLSETPTSTPTPKTPEEKAAAQLTKYLEVRDDAFRAATIEFKRLNKVATGREFLNVQQNVSGIERSQYGLCLCFIPFACKIQLLNPHHLSKHCHGHGNVIYSIFTNMVDESGLFEYKGKAGLPI